MLGTDAESALYAIGDIRLEFPKPRRWSWRAWHRVQSKRDRLRMELAYPRVIGAAENYLVMHLARSMKPELLMEIAPPSKADKATISIREAVLKFRKLEELWAHELGVPLHTLAGWSALMEARNIRHVLIHRLGRWEPGLDPQPTLSTRIGALGRHPATYRGQFPLSLADCESSASLAAQVIVAAEAALGRL